MKTLTNKSEKGTRKNLMAVVLVACLSALFALGCVEDDPEDGDGVDTNFDSDTETDSQADTDEPLSEDEAEPEADQESEEELEPISGAETDTEQDEETDLEVDQELTSWPHWDEFSPLKESQDPELLEETEPTEEVVEETVQVEGEDGQLEDLLQDVTYECTQKTYSMTDTPEKMVMYGNPDKELLWPGALIQGKSLRDGEGIGSLLPLTIDQRAPLEIHIPSIMNDDNFREVENPTMAKVGQAIGSMVGNATTSNLSTPSTIDYKKEESFSAEQFALNLKMSARYLGFSVSAEAGIERNANEHTIIAHFWENMFEVEVQPPQTPGGFFSEDFDADKLQEQMDLGRMGPDNLPVYVSSVVYGRMMIFSFTSTDSVEKMVGAIEASYNGSTIHVEGGVEVDCSQTLQNAKIEVIAVGGDSDAAISLIREGNLADYFTESAPLSSAVPISYTFRNLGDNSIAKVSETTEYTVKECTALPPEEPEEEEEEPEVNVLCGEPQFYNGSKYWLCEVDRTWQEASDYCKEYGAHLVSINDDNEFVFLRNFTEDAVWTGANDLEEEGSWVWESGEEWAGDAYFASGEPSNSNGAEDCAELNGNYVGELNDLPCKYSKRFICEYNS